MRAFLFLAVSLVVTAVDLSVAQRMLSCKPRNPIVCHHSFENRIDHVGVSERIKEMRRNGTGRVKTATFEVQYVNFPADNLAKTAFQYAIDIWESELVSPVPVRIIAEWKPLATGVQAEAVWGRAYANFGGEQHINTFYPVALAEKISGRDLNDVAEADIVASFNSTSSWYFGTDGNTPAGKMDMVTVGLHEIAHGLGFTDTYHVEGTEGAVGLATGGVPIPFIFDVFVEDNTGDNLLHDFQSPSSPLKDALQSTNLFFNSPLSATALNGVKPELFAPTTFNAGSSVSHLDEGTFNANGDPNRLMTPHISFGESIHDPGGVLLGMLGDMGWIHTNIQHVPLKDTELKNGQPYAVTVTIRSDNGYDAGQVKLHYTNDGVNYTVVNMSATGAPDEFESSLPGTTTDMAYAYFISVVDGADRIFTNPGKVQESGSQPEQGTHFFSIGPDVTAPDILHEPVTYIMEDDTNLALAAEVTDNQGVQEVLVEYSVNGGAVQTQVLVKDPASDEYSANIGLPALAVGSQVEYRVVARDLAITENITYHPTSGYHVVAVNGILPAQDSYVNNFNAPSDDFFGNSFSITTPAGFQNGAIHSDHPYNNGTGTNQESNYVYQLQIPIRVNASNPYIRFDEIVLVEPGEDGSQFGEPGFFDYAVVEGSADGGNTWLPIAPGYDSRDISVWLSRYNSNIADDNSQSSGDPSLYRTRTMSLLDNQSFGAGQEVLIRFRLFADALAHGWGWAIDNLSIQGPVTGVEQSPDHALNVYPVPAFTVLFLEFYDTAETHFAFTINDLSGKTIVSDEMISSPGMNKFSIDLGALQEGFYVLKMNRGDSVYYRKFLKLAH